jgi:hypothetical protein
MQRRSSRCARMMQIVASVITRKIAGKSDVGTPMESIGLLKPEMPALRWHASPLLLDTLRVRWVGACFGVLEFFRMSFYARSNIFAALVDERLRKGEAEFIHRELFSIGVENRIPPILV